MISIEAVFTPFFSEVAGIVAAEKTLHALFYHHLLESGLAPQQVGREFRIGKNPVDLVLFENVTQRHARCAIEFKGGAYGNRNALHDTVDSNGYCGDMAKLNAFHDSGVVGWFVCVDMATLGVALGEANRRLVADQCRQHGLGFAYYCTGETNYLIQSPGKPLRQQPMTLSKSAVKHLPTSAIFSSTDAPIKAFARVANTVFGSEDDYSALLYRTLRLAGLGVGQLSLETYFNFASKPGSRMQWRPDLTVFEPGVNGCFNLYRDGNVRHSNDAHKLHYLRALVEVKGSQTLATKGDVTLAKIYSDDIAKLGRWRTAASEACERLGLTVKRPVEFVFVGVDARAHRLAAEVERQLRGEAERYGVNFVYVPR
jgi:hypothetical protein